MPAYFYTGRCTCRPIFYVNLESFHWDVGAYEEVCTDSVQVQTETQTCDENTAVVPEIAENDIPNGVYEPFKLLHAGHWVQLTV